MEKSHKNVLIVVSAILLVGGGIAYYYNRKSRKAAENSPATTPTNDTANSAAQSTNSASQSTPAASKNAVQPIKVATAQIKLVKADDVLSANVNGANGKALYATAVGSVYNMANQKAFNTTKNQYLGVVAQARKSTNGYIINFLGNGNVKYWIPSALVAIKLDNSPPAKQPASSSQPQNNQVASTTDNTAPWWSLMM